MRDPGYEYPAEFGLNIFDFEEDEQFDEDMADNVNHTEQILKSGEYFKKLYH